MKKSNKKIKVVITDNIRKGLRRGDICELSRGYAKYLFNNDKAIHYSPFMECVYKSVTENIISYNKEYENLRVHLNNIYLHFVRISNKSFTLYSKITKEEVFNEMKNYLKQKNISNDLQKIFDNINISNIINLPNIKSGNQVYSIELQGHLDGVKIHICVNTTEEECQKLQNKHMGVK